MLSPCPSLPIPHSPLPAVTRLTLGTLCPHRTEPGAAPSVRPSLQSPGWARLRAGREHRGHRPPSPDSHHRGWGKLQGGKAGSASFSPQRGCSHRPCPLLTRNSSQGTPLAPPATLPPRRAGKRPLLTTPTSTGPATPGSSWSRTALARCSAARRGCRRRTKSKRRDPAALRGAERGGTAALGASGPAPCSARPPALRKSRRERPRGGGACAGQGRLFPPRPRPSRRERPGAGPERSGAKNPAPTGPLDTAPAQLSVGFSGLSCNWARSRRRVVGAGCEAASASLGCCEALWDHVKSSVPRSKGLSWIHRTPDQFGVEQISVQAPWQGRATQSRCHRNTSRWVWNLFRQEYSMISLGCLLLLRQPEHKEFLPHVEVKNFLCFSLWPLPCLWALPVCPRQAAHPSQCILCPIPDT